MVTDKPRLPGVLMEKSCRLGTPRRERSGDHADHLGLSSSDALPIRQGMLMEGNSSGAPRGLKRSPQ